MASCFAAFNCCCGTMQSRRLLLLLMVLMSWTCSCTIALRPSTSTQLTEAALRLARKQASGAGAKTTEVSHNGKDLADSVCPQCARVNDEDLAKKIFIERWKADLLKKLGMDQVPKRPSTSNVGIPTPLYGAYMENPRKAEAEADGGNEQVIVIGKKADKMCGKDCFYFRLSRNILSQQKVSSVQLWINQEATATPSGPHPGNRTLLVLHEWLEPSTTPMASSTSQRVTRHRMGRSSGWVVVDVSLPAGSQLALIRKKEIAFYLRMKCHGCSLSSASSNMPFLVINTKRTSARRKRSIDCHSQVTECCRERLYINFTDFGWNDWIIQPPGYEAYHCRGSCRSSSMPAFSHTSIIQRFNQFKNSDRQEQYIKTCCSPRRFSPMSLLYYDSEGRIYKKDVPDMSVEECGCS